MSLACPRRAVLELSFSKTGTSARTIRVLHTDHLGSTVGISDELGAKRETRAYESFGKVAVSGTPTRVKAGFTGHEQDVTGLINMRGRMYDATIGRFLTPDPIVQAPLNSQSWNGYSYVMNSPQNGTDPSGFAGQGNYDTPTVPECVGTCLGNQAAAASYSSNQAAPAPMDFCESNPGGCRGIKQPLQAEPGVAASAGAAAAAEAAAAAPSPQRTIPHGGHHIVFPEGLTWGTPRASDVYDAVAETSRIMQQYAPVAGAVGIVVASMFPYVGETLDAAQVLAPNSSMTDRVVGGFSLAFSLMSAGFLPNAGAIKRAAAMLSDGGGVVGRGAAGAADDVVDVYRGVGASHPGLPEARMGSAYPIGGHSDPLLHSAGDTASEFTSWTTDPRVAQWFAGKHGPGGVVLKDTVSRSQLISGWVEEAEVLRQGAVEGAQVLFKW